MQGNMAKCLVDVNSDIRHDSVNEGVIKEW
jgi:hypothetical protein